MKIKFILTHGNHKRIHQTPMEMIVEEKLTTNGKLYEVTYNVINERQANMISKLLGNKKYEVI